MMLPTDFFTRNKNRWRTQRRGGRQSRRNINDHGLDQRDSRNHAGVHIGTLMSLEGGLDLASGLLEFCRIVERICAFLELFLKCNNLVFLHDDSCNDFCTEKVLLFAVGFEFGEFDC